MDLHNIREFVLHATPEELAEAIDETKIDLNALKNSNFTRFNAQKYTRDINYYYEDTLSNGCRYCGDFNKFTQDGHTHSWRTCPYHNCLCETDYRLENNNPTELCLEKERAINVNKLRMIVSKWMNKKYKEYQNVEETITQRVDEQVVEAKQELLAKKNELNEREKNLDSYEENMKKINDEKEAEFTKKMEIEEKQLETKKIEHLKKMEKDNKKFINFVEAMSSDENREQYKTELKEHMEDRENYKQKLKSLDARELAVEIREKKVEFEIDCKLLSEKQEEMVEVMRKAETIPDDNCAICQEPLINNYMTLNCSHKFHSKCVIDFMKNGITDLLQTYRNSFEINKNNCKCPICRAPIFGQ